MDAGRDSLGGMLRVWRDRRHPRDLGLPSAGDRRAPGLRREELASLAGISVDYLIRLEQGRATSPTPQVANALSRALQLDRAERDLLSRLAGLLPPDVGRIDDHIPPGLQRLLARLGDVAVAVYAADWTLVSWTPLWAALLGEPGAERNMVRAHFLGDGANSDGANSDGANSDSAEHGQIDSDAVVSIGGVSLRHPPGGLEEFRASLVGDLRRAASEHPHDGRLALLLDELRTSPSFERLWASGAVGTHLESQKTVLHPTAGEILVDCDVLLVPGTGHRVVTYTAAVGSVDAERLDFLRATAGIAF